jgi:lactoylglutathione lyase
VATALGYCVLHVADVAAALEFYERAFGLRRRMIEDGIYAELETGETVLAFSERRYAESYACRTVAAERSGPPPSIEVALFTDDVARLHERALAAGAEHVRSAETKPWGQVVSFVRDPDGYLVQLCSPARVV